MTHTENSSESEKGKTRKSSDRGDCGDRVNARNNTRDSVASTTKYYKGGIEEFGALLNLKYKKVELDKSFDVFGEKQINYTIKYLKN